MLISAYITHKKAEHYSDCQDRFSINPDTKSIALSDGMSQSIFQKYWAEILVNTFTSNSEWVPNREAVKELSPIWRNKVEENIKVQKSLGNRSVWRAERSLFDGHSAGATFLGIRFNGLNWEGDVLGDSCLVLVNNNQIKNIYSSEDVEVFDSYPDFFDSNPQKEGKGVPKNIKGTLEAGDSILMVSDPFSDFLLKNRGTQEESKLIDRLLGVNSHKEFVEVVEEWRRKGMHNDDSTLIIIKQDGKDSFNFNPFPDDILKLIEEDKKESNISQKINNDEDSQNPQSEKEVSQEDESNHSLKDIKFEEFLSDSFKIELKQILIKDILGWKDRALKKEKNQKKLDNYIQEIINLIKQKLT